RSFGSALLPRPMQERIDRMTKSLVQAFEQQWLSQACVSEWRRLDRPSAEEAVAGSSVHDGSVAASSTPAVSSATPSEDWRGRFGDHALTRFAFEVVSRICRPSPLRDAYRSTMLSTTDPPQFVELAKQALSSISSRNADSPASAESHSDALQALAYKLAATGHRVF